MRETAEPVKIGPAPPGGILASKVAIDRRSNRFSLTIDGEEFPWFIAEDGVTVKGGPNEMQRVTIVLLAETTSIRL